MILSLTYNVLKGGYITIQMFDSLKNRFQLRFKNREIAASILAGALEDSLKKLKIDKKQNELLVLGIPRGGIIIADIIVSKLKSSSFICEFDIIIPRKLGAPGNQEIAIGAIMEDETSYFNEDIIKELEISQEDIENEKARTLQEIKRRKSLYRNSNHNKEYNLENKVVIIVDDGAATGATLIAAARWLRNKANQKKLIIAIPVAVKDTLEVLEKECDMVVTGTTVSSTSSFKSVAQFYQEFKPVEDEKVVKICKKYKLVDVQ
jgi:putative phosphoribosyl transferase